MQSKFSISRLSPRGRVAHRDDMSWRIVSRHRGRAHGFIERLVSPGDLGEQLKPFVFLDHLHGDIPQGAGFGWHPHSGIATLTYQLDADTLYEDTTGQRGRVEATGLEWMRAGGGTWHRGTIQPAGARAEGFQLWIALPPTLESGPSVGIYVRPADVPQVGNARVLLGEYQGQTCPIPVPSPLRYLDVVLAAGERWTLPVPAEHDVAWLLVYRGEARVAGEPTADELAVLGGAGELALEATTPARVLIGTARRHAHALVLGTHSVHTSPEALARGVAKIDEVGHELQATRRLS